MGVDFAALLSDPKVVVGLLGVLSAILGLIIRSNSKAKRIEKENKERAEVAAKEAAAAIRASASEQKEINKAIRDADDRFRKWN